MHEPALKDKWYIEPESKYPEDMDGDGWRCLGR